MRASDRPRTLYAGTGTLNELVGVAVRASLGFARVSGGMGASPRSPVHTPSAEGPGRKEWKPPGPVHTRQRVRRQATLSA
jgi:hypothetical protein